jgi:NAD(P)-dependent dehydrogenase (short-subunit alcohol dehydrogenase family)
MVSNLFDLSGKVALITGSSRGIGRGIAEAMALHGASVVISSRKPDACEHAVADILAKGGSAEAIPCNVSRPEERENLIETTLKEWGHIDILVLNAAANPYYGPNLEIPDDAFDKVLDVNIKSVMAMCKLVAPSMRARKQGAIIIVSSITGLVGNVNIGAYGLTKAADMQIARNLACELGPDNIRVNCLAPGVVRTDFSRALWEDDAASKEVTDRTPLGRLGEVEDISGAAVFLASKAGAWTTGQTIVIDGGDTIKGF